MKIRYLLALVLTSLPALAAEPIHGIAKAIDGDSIKVGDHEVRLQGVDAPEFKQTCGQGRARCGKQAYNATAALVDGKEVTCENEGTDKYGRVLGICRTGEIEVNDFLVRQGYAVAYLKYSLRYQAAEKEARDNLSGIWAQGFQLPEQYRRDHPRK